MALVRGTALGGPFYWLLIELNRLKLKTELHTSGKLQFDNLVLLGLEAVGKGQIEEGEEIDDR